MATAQTIGKDLQAQVKADPTKPAVRRANGWTFLFAKIGVSGADGVYQFQAQWQDDRTPLGADWEWLGHVVREVGCPDYVRSLKTDPRKMAAGEILTWSWTDADRTAPPLEN